MDADWPPSGETSAGAEWAKLAAVYDLLCQELVADLPFYLGWAAEHVAPGSLVLELGVGTGRVAEAVLRAGYRVLGADSSPDMLDRARVRLAPFGDRCRLRQTDLSDLVPDEPVDLAVAAYGTLAQVLTEAERLAVFRGVHAALRPGGWFVYDDRPAWLGAPDDLNRFVERWTRLDPATGQLVRLTTNSLLVAAASYSLNYQILDWLVDERVTRREVARLVFRDGALADELGLLREAGFAVTLLGGFDGRPFELADPAANDRLICCCRRQDE